MTKPTYISKGVTLVDLEVIARGGTATLNQIKKLSEPNLIALGCDWFYKLSPSRKTELVSLIGDILNEYEEDA